MTAKAFDKTFLMALSSPLLKEAHAKPSSMFGFRTDFEVVQRINNPAEVVFDLRIFFSLIPSSLAANFCGTNQFNQSVDRSTNECSPPS